MYLRNSPTTDARRSPAGRIRRISVLSSSRLHPIALVGGTTCRAPSPAPVVHTLTSIIAFQLIGILLRPFAPLELVQSLHEILGVLDEARLVVVVVCGGSGSGGGVLLVAFLVLGWSFFSQTIGRQSSLGCFVDW